MSSEDVFAWVQKEYGTIPDYPWNDQNAVLRHKKSGKWYGVILKVQADKLGMGGKHLVDVLNVKCDPILIGSLREKPGIFPAYHMNKEHWISILLNESTAKEEVIGLLAMSYDLTK